ncbi:hypothetical protein [Catenuloplanes indicus]|uniref:Uncharacterized protein n=1 Tax=Catenuloplanes indicus TaxID=137267 RepID=A0AAE3VZY3_9ACTN|nr:hypothetical protein [Catenuloplanes indicus]MDQ0366921.1 hypothetical protein [Catenuloplanes indicus]
MILLPELVALVPLDVPNPAPIDPTGGAQGVELLFAYLKWGVLGICGAIALASAGYMAWGALSHRPEENQKGKRAFLISGAATVAAAIAIPMVNNVFSAVG